MCIEQAFKRGGISIIRNFLHQTEGVKAGLPELNQSRMTFSYKWKTYKDGKLDNFKMVDQIVDGFKGKGDSK